MKKGKLTDEFADSWLATALGLSPVDKSTLAEQVYNGGHIDWGYWLRLNSISPGQAAKLVMGIDPAKWPNDEHAQGPYQSEFREKLAKVTQLLSEQGEGFSLRDLGEFLDDDAPGNLVRVLVWEERYQTGRYRLNEAAALLGRFAGERGNSLRDKLVQAVKEGKLKVYEPGRNAVWKSREVRDFHDEAYWEDLNEWLEANEPRINWRFPSPPNSESPDSSSSRLRSEGNMERQERAILQEIENRGLNALKLPANKPGRPGIKSSLREALAGTPSPLFQSKNVFENAWERLRAQPRQVQYEDEK